MPFILSLSLAFFMADSILSSPRLLIVFPVSVPRKSSCPCSSITPDRLRTITELLLTSGVLSPEAIIPTMLIIPMKVTIAPKAISPTTVARTCLKKFFIRIQDYSISKIMLFLQ